MERIIKVGVAGLGNAGRNIHLEILKQRNDFEVCAVCATNLARLQEAESVFGCPGYERFEDLCGDEHIDMIVIATTSHLHASMAMQAMRAGKHVVCEKPMATSAGDAEAMIAVSQETGKMLTVFHNRRLDPDLRYVREVIHSGRLGSLYKIHRNVMNFAIRQDWQLYRNKGGGMLNNWGSHTIDQILYLMQDVPAVKYADVKWLLGVGDAEDYAHFILKFEGGPVVEQELTHSAMQKLPDWLLLGDRGALKIEQAQAVLEYEERGSRIVENIALHGAGLSDWAKFYDNLYDYLTAKDQLLVKAKEACAVIRIIESIRQFPQENHR